MYIIKLMDEYDFADDIAIENKILSINRVLDDIINKNINYDKIIEISIEELIKSSQNFLLKNKIYNLEYYLETITQNYLLTDDLLFLRNIFNLYKENLRIQDLYDLYYESIKNNYFISFKYLTDILENNSSIELLCYINNSVEFLKYLLLKNKIKKNTETFFKAIYYNCVEFLEELHNNKCDYDLNELITIFIPYKCFKFLNDNGYDLQENISENYLLQIIRNFNYKYFLYYLDNNFYYNYNIIYNIIDDYYDIFSIYLNRISKYIKFIEFNDNKFYILDNVYFFGCGDITFSTTTEIKNLYNDYIKTLYNKNKKDIQNLKDLVSLLFKMKIYLQDKTNNPLHNEETKKDI